MAKWKKIPRGNIFAGHIMNFYSLFRPFIFAIPEEMAHNTAICLLKHKLLPKSRIYKDKILQNSIAGINFENPIGLAAGFDKNADAIDALSSFGFGFIEVGTVTPKPQDGNPKPRIFRLKEDEAIINRLGFNNKGLDYFAEKLKNKRTSTPVGANIGKNKDTENALDDYTTCMEKIYGLSDYITINISSPNTPGLRALQKKEALDALLSGVIAKRSALAASSEKNIPIFLKIAPDINAEEQKDIAELALKSGIDGLIISNTTLSRHHLENLSHSSEAGGLSGKPLFDLSNKVLKDMYKLTAGKIPLIAAGGVFSAEDAYTKIRLGASLVQVYTALIYKGMGLPSRINRKLAKLLKKDGFSNISQAIGVDNIKEHRNF